jgi:hypothetical protein
MKLYKEMAVSSIYYECWNINPPPPQKKKPQQTEAAEMRFRRPIKEYIKWRMRILALNIFSLCEKWININKNIMNTSYKCQLTKFLGSSLISIQTEERTEANHWRDGWSSLTNLTIRTGKNLLLSTESKSVNAGNQIGWKAIAFSEPKLSRVKAYVWVM